jgi:hypothetical protein
MNMVNTRNSTPTARDLSYLEGASPLIISNIDQWPLPYVRHDKVTIRSENPEIP